MAQQSDSNERRSLTDTEAGTLIERLLPTGETPEVDEPQDEAPSEDEEDGEQDVVEESESDDGQDADEAPPAPRKIRVKIGGEELEVTEEEAAKGYSRTEDYTRKTQKLAEERKAFEQHATAILEERQRYAQSLHLLEQTLAPTLEEPDWTKLREELDPGEFAAEVAEYQLRQARVKEVQAEQIRVAQLQQRDMLRAQAVYLQQQRDALLNAVPEWKEPARVKQDMDEIVNYATTLGFTADDVAEVADHRLFRVLRDAARFAKLQKSSPSKPSATPAATPAAKQTATSIKPLAAGATVPTRKPTTDLTRAKQRLAKTGSERDAAAVFEHLL